MEKEFIPYEQALELKELGFDGKCVASYYTDDIENFKENTFDYRGHFSYEYSNSTDDFVVNTEKTYYVSAPTFSQAFRWFREKYTHNASVYPLNGKFSSQVYDIFRGCYITKIDLYETYEEAEIECLKKLIEIVKKQKEYESNINI